MKRVFVKSIALWVTILVIACLGVFCLAGCGETAGPEVPSNVTVADGVATVYVPDGRDARVLVLGDPSQDSLRRYSIVGADGDKTIALLGLLVDSESPDLVLLTGDLAITGAHNNWRYIRQIADIFEQRHIPWSFVFGDNDCPDRYANEADDEDSIWGQMTKPHLIETLHRYYGCCLLQANAEEGGAGNHVIQVRSESGTLLHTFVGLDCVDEEEEPTRAAWYLRTVQALATKEGGKIDHTILTHRPVDEVYTAYAQSGSRLYGEMVHPMEEGQSALFAAAKEGGAHAILFGHDIDSDWTGVYQGVYLGFVQHSSLSTAYRIATSREFAMMVWPSDTVFDFSVLDTLGDKRGGTLLTLSAGNMHLAPVYATDLAGYSDLAIDIEEVCRQLVKKRGEKSVIRANE